MNNINKISIVICALNEEKNIGNLLYDIIEQDLNNLCNSLVYQIIVVSDGSTDNTINIVGQLQKKDNRIKLIINEFRMGKIFCLDKVFRDLDSDFAILFDADIRLDKNTIETLLKTSFNSGNMYDLIGGNPVPFYHDHDFNIARNASFFSWLLVQKIKKFNPKSIYCSHGRILMLSKKLYKKLNIGLLSSPGDDQYIFLMSSNFYYEKEAIVRYFLPNTIGDYIKQNTRFRKAKLLRGLSVFNKEHVRESFNIKNKYIILIQLILTYPFKALCWVILYMLGYLKFKILIQNSMDINRIWGEVKSTK